MAGLIANIAKKCLMHIFHYGQYVGVDILPRHFYSEIPDIRKLKRVLSWKKPYSLAGIAGAALDEQLEFVERTLAQCGQSAESRGNVYALACSDNEEPGFGPVEAEFLYAFIGAYKPSHIIQVGYGVSTAVCLRAASEAAYKPKITCIDPFPTKYLRESHANNTVELVAHPVEEIDANIVDRLKKNDLFFVDSTHCLGPSGETTRLILEFLPRLNKGTFVHFHDIYFPYDYSGDILSKALFFHHESPLLQAFLAFNSRFKIEASLSMLHYAASDKLKQMIPSYAPRRCDDGLALGPGHFPSSTYLRVISG